MWRSVNYSGADMIFNNSQIRRQDRLLDEEQAAALLRQGEYGVLSMTDGDGRAYGIPLNYVWDGQRSIYLHCAPEGCKLHCMAHDNRVSFCVVGRTCVLPEKFSTEYESIVLECGAHRNLSAEERMRGLLLLVDKYSPGFREKGITYAEKSFARTELIRLNVAQWSGKCKKIRTQI